MNFNKYKLNQIKNLLSKEFINKINVSINKELNLLKKDYELIDIDKSLIKETLLCRALSYKVINDKLKNSFEKKINSYLSKNSLKKKNQKYIINPLVYIRFCNPREKLIKNYKSADLYTEPHYDKSFDKIKFHSIWLPLEKTSYETGSLCYFKIPGKLRKKNFPISGKNKYSIHNYFKNPESADRILSSHTNPVYLNKGDVIFFNSYCLHGATKPISKRRLSINFQVFDSKVLKSQNSNEKNKFLLSNYSMDICNLLNLLLIGDMAGAKRIYKKMDKKKLKNSFSMFNEDVNINIKKLISRISNTMNNDFKKNYEKNLHYSKELSILKKFNSDMI